jgi:putative phage-type endonuclease
MITSNVQQGSSAWLELRRTHDTASEAPAALGVSKYTSRTALMHQKFTDEVETVGSAKQAVFDRGHEAEALARPFAEKIIGADLYPTTGTLEVDGLKLLASLDGATMDEEIIWEHKLWNASLAEDVRNGTLDPHYTVQMDQQLRVSGAKKCLFMVSDGTEENMVWCWYVTSEEKQSALIAGWKQFNADLALYVPPEVIVPPVAAPQMGLPAVAIQVNGSIKLVDNLDKFGAALTAYVDRINKKPESDQDFADLEATVKTLKNAEDALDAAESSALAQTDSIDAMRKTVALYRETARTNRLLVEKLVKAEKENRRTAIVSEAAAELVTHVKKLNERLGKPYLPSIAADFQGVVKGLKSLDSMKDKVSTELARCKIAANESADRIQANLTTLRELASEHTFLFADTAQLVLKANDDLTALVKSRIADHKAAEAKREEETREGIRAEEQAKAEKEAADRQAKANAAAMGEIQGIQQQVYIAITGRAGVRKGGTIECIRETLAETEAWVIDDRFGTLKGSAQSAKDTAIASIRQLLQNAEAKAAAPAPMTKITAIPEAGVQITSAPANLTHSQVVAQMPPAVRKAMAPKPTSEPTLKVGEISERLGFTLTADFIKVLGFEPAKVDRASKLFHPEEFPEICRALILHIEAVMEQFEEVSA